MRVKMLSHWMTSIYLAGSITPAMIDGDAAALDQVCQSPPKLLHFDARQVTFVNTEALDRFAVVARAVHDAGGVVTMQASPVVRGLVESSHTGQLFGLPPGRSRRVGIS